jgi:uncharacterized protein YkwD
MRTTRLWRPARPALLLVLCAVAGATLASEVGPAPEVPRAREATPAREAAPAELLAAHNRYRAALGIAPLAWSGELAASAAAWAQQLVAKGRFEHSQVPHGENLWLGTAGAYTQTSMVDNWGEEQQHYVHGVFPKVTKGGVVGHYTQMVWRNTTRVGCGLATGKGVEVLVCHYDPPGNYHGQTPY